MDAVRCQGLTRRRLRRAIVGPRSRPAVDRLDLTVAGGEVVGLVGPGGAGKTTVLRLLTGLVRPSAGSAWLLGSPVPCPDRLAEVGAMIGRPGAHPWLTGREQLDVLLRSGPPAPPGAVDRALELAGLRRLAGRRIGTWAAPARHRLALAAALLRRPRVLLLDEPVAGLDAEGTASVAALLAELAGQGVAMLVAARRLGTLEPLCDRVAVLDGGRLVADRPPGTVRVRLDPADHHDAVRLLDGYRLLAEAPGVLLVGDGDSYTINQRLAGGGVYAQGIETATGTAGAAGVVEAKGAAGRG